MPDPYSVGPEMVRHVAELAALEMDASEETHFIQELNRILDYMKQLKNLDTEHLEATFQAFPLSNVTRRDEVAESLTQKEVLQNAPDPERSFFKIPPILDNEA